MYGQKQRVGWVGDEERNAQKGKVKKKKNKKKNERS